MRAVSFREVPRASRPFGAPFGRRRHCPPELLLIALLAGGAVLGTAAGLGNIVRLLYPLAALLIGGRLFALGNRTTYIVFCLWLFVITPGLRRYIDFHTGFAAVSPVMLAPWLAASFSLIVILPLLGGPRSRFTGAILLAIVAASYGLLVGALSGRVVAAGFDWLRWSVPPCFGLIILATARADPGLKPRLLSFLALSAALLGLYGFWQFIALPPWDALWMSNVQMNSIGKPRPYLVRVFSLLNSPGSLANFLSIAGLYLFAFVSPLRAGGLALGSLAFLLSLVRSAWGAFGLAALWLVLLGSRASKLRALLAVGAAILLLGVASSVPDVASTLQARYASLTDLSQDASYQDRIAHYGAFLRRMDGNWMGGGLGLTGSTEANLSGQTVVYMDGEIMEVYSALGLLAGTLYLGAALYCLLAAVRTGARSREPLALASSAAALAGLVLVPYGSPLVGDTGMFVWMAVGLSRALAPPQR